MINHFLDWVAAEDESHARWALRFFGSSAIAGVLLAWLIRSLVHLLQ